MVNERCGNDRAHNGDSHGDTDLLAHGAEPGGKALFGVGQSGGGGHHEPNDGGEVRDAADERGHQYEDQRTLAGVDEKQGSGGGCLDGEAGDDRVFVAEPADELRCNDPADHGADAEDGEGQSGTERGVAEDLLQVQRENEHQ
ncbi:hypothetical protein D9M72_555400 [compost metagenome]